MEENFKKLAVLFDNAARLSGQIARNYNRPVFDIEDHKIWRYTLDETLNQVSILIGKVRDYEYQIARLTGNK